MSTLLEQARASEQQRRELRARDRFVSSDTDVCGGCGFIAPNHSDECTVAEPIGEDEGRCLGCGYVGRFVNGIGCPACWRDGR